MRMQFFDARRAIVVLALVLAGSCSAIGQSIDAFNPLPNAPPTTVAVQANGRIILAGNFLSVANMPKDRIARFNSDGSLDTTFQDPGINGEINAVALQLDGKIVLGGSFTAIGSDAHHFLARLNADGSLDTGFSDPGLDGSVASVVVQPDDKVLAGGDFTQVVTNQGTFSRLRVARFQTNGALDGTYADPQLDPGVSSSPVFCVALQADGSVLVGGHFTHVGTISHFYFARFSNTGVFDAAFPVSDTTQVAAIVVAPDGSILVDDPGAGEIIKYSSSGVIDATYASAAADGLINSLALQPDGKIVIGGTFQSVDAQSHHALARLNTNGTLDTSFADLNFNFSAGNPHGYIYAIAAQSNGNVIVSGNFTIANGQSRQYVAQVTTNAATSTLTAVAVGPYTLVTWTRTGAGPELSLPPTLMHSVDGIHFTAVGPMSRVANGWQVTAPYRFTGPVFYLQALGFTSGGAGNGSPGSVASPVYSNDLIFANGFEVGGTP